MRGFDNLDFVIEHYGILRKSCEMAAARFAQMRAVEGLDTRGHSQLMWWQAVEEADALAEALADAPQISVEETATTPGSIIAWPLTSSVLATARQLEKSHAWPATVGNLFEGDAPRFRCLLVAPLLVAYSAVELPLISKGGLC